MTSSPKQLLQARDLVDGFAATFRKLTEADYVDTTAPVETDWLSDGELSSYEVAKANSLSSAQWAISMGLPVVAWAQAVKSLNGKEYASKAARQFAEKVRQLYAAWGRGAMDTATFFQLMRQEMRKQGKNSFRAGKLSLGSVTWTEQDAAEFAALMSADEGAMARFEEEVEYGSAYDALKIARQPSIWAALGAGLVGGYLLDPLNYSEMAWNMMRRVDMYAQSLSRYVGQGEMAALRGVRDQTVVWWELGSSDHCVDCIALSESSPLYLYVLQDNAVFPGSGHTKCGANCNCGLSYDVPSVFCGDGLAGAYDSLDMLEDGGSVYVLEAAACQNPIDAGDLIRYGHGDDPAIATSNSEVFDWNEELQMLMVGDLDDAVAWRDIVNEDDGVYDMLWLLRTKVKERALLPAPFPTKTRSAATDLVERVAGYGSVRNVDFVPSADLIEVNTRLKAVFGSRRSKQIDKAMDSYRTWAAAVPDGREKMLMYWDDVLARAEHLKSQGFDLQQIKKFEVGFLPGANGQFTFGNSRRMVLERGPYYRMHDELMGVRSASRSIGDTFGHEYGHAVHNAIKRKGSEYQTRLNMLRRQMDDVATTRAVSPYATDDGYEWFAEVFQKITRPGYVKGDIPYDEDFWQVIVDAGQATGGFGGPPVGRAQFIGSSVHKDLKVSKYYAGQREYTGIWHEYSRALWFDYGHATIGDDLLDPEFTLRMLRDMSTKAAAEGKPLYINAQTAGPGMKTWLNRLGIDEVMTGNRPWFKVDDTAEFAEAIGTVRYAARRVPDDLTALGKFQTNPLSSVPKTLGDQFGVSQSFIDDTIDVSLRSPLAPSAKNTTEASWLINSRDYGARIIENTDAWTDTQWKLQFRSLGVVGPRLPEDEKFVANLAALVKTREHGINVGMVPYDRVAFPVPYGATPGDQKFIDMLLQAGGEMSEESLTTFGFGTKGAKGIIVMEWDKFEDLGIRIQRGLPIDNVAREIPAYKVMADVLPPNLSQLGDDMYKLGYVDDTFEATYRNKFTGSNPNVTLKSIGGAADEDNVSRAFRDVLDHADNSGVRLAIDDTVLEASPALRRFLEEYGGTYGKYKGSKWMDLTMEQTQLLRRALTDDPDLLLRAMKQADLPIVIPKPRVVPKVVDVPTPSASAVDEFAIPTNVDVTPTRGVGGDIDLTHKWPEPDDLELVPLKTSNKENWGWNTKVFMRDKKTGQRYMLKIDRKAPTNAGYVVSENAAELGARLGIPTPPVQDSFRIKMTRKELGSLRFGKAKLAQLEKVAGETDVYWVEGIMSPILPGSIQKLGTPDLGKKGVYQAFSEMEPEHIQDLMNHQVLDWVLANDDAHIGQWIVSEDGIMWAIDKDRTFKTLGAPHLKGGGLSGGDSLNPWLNGSQRADPSKVKFSPMANIFWRNVETNPALLDVIDPDTIAPTLRRLQSISDDEYLEVFDSVIRFKAANPTTAFPQFDSADDLRKAILQRKHDALDDIEQLYRSQIQKAMDYDIDAVPDVWKDWMAKGGRFDLDLAPTVTEIGDIKDAAETWLQVSGMRSIKTAARTSDETPEVLAIRKLIADSKPTKRPLYRGMFFADYDMTDDQRRFLRALRNPGDEVSFELSSFSQEIDTAMDFSGRPMRGVTGMDHVVVELEPGASAGYLSKHMSFKSGKEWVAEGRFRVVDSYTDADGFLRVRIKQVDDVFTSAVDEVPVQYLDDTGDFGKLVNEGAEMYDDNVWAERFAKNGSFTDDEQQAIVKMANDWNHEIGGDTLDREHLGGLQMLAAAEQMTGNKLTGRYAGMVDDVRSAEFDRGVELAKRYIEEMQRQLRLRFPGGKVTLYRGRMIDVGDSAGYSVGQAIDARLNPISSWTLDEDVAFEFARGWNDVETDGIVMMTEVDIGDIIGVPGYGVGVASEAEVLVMKPETPTKITQIWAIDAVPTRPGWD